MEETAEAPVEAPTEPPPETNEFIEAAQERGTIPEKPTPLEYKAKIEDVIKAAENDETLASDEEHKGISFDEQIKALPDDSKKLLANLRRDYTQKTQELAKQRGEIEAQRKALFESDAFKAIQEMSQKELGEFDPYNPDSVLEHINRKVAEQFKDMLRPMQDAQVIQQKKAKLNQFMVEHPDLKNDEVVRTQVKDLLMGNETLDLESAYWIAKGRSLTDANARQAEELGRYKSAAQSAGLKISGGTRLNNTVKPPDGLDAYGIYQWFQKHGAKQQ